MDKNTSGKCYIPNWTEIVFAVKLLSQGPMFLSI